MNQESHVPLFALAGSLRGWHQKGLSQRLGIPNLAELRQFLPRQVDIAAQLRIENLPRHVALLLPYRTLQHSCSALLSKHRPRGNEIGRSRSRINLVMSTVKLRSGNCVK